MNRHLQKLGMTAGILAAVWMVLSPALGAELVGAVDMTLGPPFISRSQARAEGLLVELYSVIALELKRNLRLSFIPRKRLAEVMADGQADVLCHVSKAWLTESDPDLVWSGPLYKAHDLLLRPQKAPIDDGDPGAISGSIATALGYYYKDLDGEFKRGRLRRIDLSSDRQIIDVVAAGHADFGVVSVFVWADRLKSDPDIGEQVKVVRRFSPVDVECQYSKSSKLAPLLRRTFEKLRADGSLYSIAAAYGALR